MDVLAKASGISRSGKEKRGAQKDDNDDDSERQDQQPKRRNLKIYYNKLKSCAVPRCGEPVVKNSYCNTHQDIDKQKPKCDKMECDKDSFLGGLCPQHYLDLDAEVQVETDAPVADTAWLLGDQSKKTIWQALTTKEGVDYYFNTETGETTWEKPEELMTAEELDQRGDWQWVPDQVECYLPGRVVGVSGPSSRLQMEDGTFRDVLTKELHALQRSSLKRVPNDLVLLDRMSPPLILHCLKQRFLQEKIYTNVGTILISINPYRVLPLYTPDVIERYIHRTIDHDLPPHVYNIAHDAFYGLKEFHQNQSVIISGESGAGKTEATKQALQYLTALAGTVSGVEKKVLQANPILEAFGNAKTLRNDNSSRFGKYMEIFFTPQNQILSTSTRNYLLEKIRVCTQAKDERNFHIFYQLTKAASSQQREKFQLHEAGTYAFLQSCRDVKSIDDAKDLHEVEQAFKDLGFSAKDVDNCFAVVSAVLAIGNINFQGEKARVATNTSEWVKTVSTLLQVDEKQLTKALTTRELRIKGQATTEVTLTAESAADTRNALAKFMYGNLFDWLVKAINNAMDSHRQTKGLKTIGILDIFGFEIFGYNTFEQLCINFTNEMLQQQFNNQTFKLEEAVYKSEKIVFQHVDFIDNQPMLDLITKRPNGILPLLDEELVMPRGSDKTFIEKLHDLHAKNAVYEKVMKNPLCFVIRHYAGKVIYHVPGFLEKNRDTLTDDLLDLLHASSHDLIKTLFPSDQQISSKDKKSSLGAQFQSQLGLLMDTLNKTEPHYIRCIKPNEQKNPITFIPRNCMEQLTYSGVFEAVAIRKQGFPFRLKHEEFQERYCCVCDNYEEVKSKETVAACRDILAALRLPKENVQMGTTRVLYRADEHRSLELVRSIKIKKIEVVENLNRLAAQDGENLPYEEQESYFRQLALAVKEADDFHLKSEAADKARVRLEKYVESRMDPETKENLETGYKNKDPVMLKKALDKCTEKGYRTKLTVKCKELYSQLVDAIDSLDIAAMRLEEGVLQRALATCSGYGLTPPMFEECKLLLAKVTRVQSLMTKASRSLDHVELATVLKNCASFGYMTTQVEKCQQMLEAVLRIREQLKDAKRALDPARIRNVVEECDKMGYQSDLVDLCRRLAARAERILDEAKKAKNSWDVNYVRVVVMAAAEIGLKARIIDKLRKLLTTDKDALLKKQFKKAQKKKQHKKAVKIDIQRKDHEIASAGDRLALANYPHLKDPMLWAKEKMMGDKEKRAAQYMVWQKEPLHAAITQIEKFVDSSSRAKLVISKIKSAFETVIKVMGQRKGPQIPADLYEMLKDALAFPEMRNDIYLIIIKQITKNPDYGAVVRGWQLLALCLTVFTPTDDFENFLEAFLRSDGNSEQYWCRGLLRERCYFGSVDPNTVPRFYRGFELDRILETRIPAWLTKVDETEGTVDMSEKSYSDLAESFYDGGYSKDILKEKEGEEPKATPKAASSASAGGGGGGGGGKSAKAPVIVSDDDDDDDDSDDEEELLRDARRKKK